MRIYTNSNIKLKEIEEKPFKLEQDIKRIFEENLETLMHLKFVKSEFTIKNKRIDTLAYDPESKAFIIIEYKRDRNASVVDQGFTYLSLMFENKADFIIEYNESHKQNLKRDDVEWSQSRVVFVSTSFTDNQIQATNFKDLAIELWEAKQYENNLLSVTPIKKSKSAASIKPLAKLNESLSSVLNEIKIYTEDDHLKLATEEVVELYDKFRAAIINLSDGIEVIPKKFYIAFKKDTNIADIELQKKGLKLFINAKLGSLDDARKLTRDVSQIGHRGNGDYQIQVDNDQNLEYIMSLIKQVI